MRALQALKQISKVLQQSRQRAAWYLQQGSRHEKQTSRPSVRITNVERPTHFGCTCSQHAMEDSKVPELRDGAAAPPTYPGYWATLPLAIRFNVFLITEALNRARRSCGEPSWAFSLVDASVGRGANVVRSGSTRVLAGVPNPRAAVSLEPYLANR